MNWLSLHPPRASHARASVRVRALAPSPRPNAPRLTVLITAAAATLCLGTAMPLSASASGSPGTRSHHAVVARPVFPLGTPDRHEPSALAPPGPGALAGYHRVYVSDFRSGALPAGWNVFTGRPSGDPGGQWGAGHVSIEHGLLDLSTWQDPVYGNIWVAGGLSQAAGSIYGAYFVRSRMTGPGATQVEMLWPLQGWPPEIDFDETSGQVNQSMATDHFTPANLQIHRIVAVNMEQWHTWGVVWTATKILYTLDGHVWGVVTNPAAIPHQPMSLHIQQQTWCSSNFACPTAPESTLVDWVAEYQPNT